MYSVVVTSLLSMGATTPQCDWFSFGGGSGCSGSSYSCNGCTGGGGFLGLFSRSSYGSCHGCYGSYSEPMMYYPLPSSGIYAPTAPMVMPGPGPTFPPPAGVDQTILPPARLGETTAPPLALNETTAGPNQVTLVVTLPAEARLYAEKQLIPATGPVRVFVTPPLEPGRTYYYELAIEVDRNGKTERRAQNVELQVGKVSRVTFPDPASEAPGKITARIIAGVAQRNPN